MKKRILSLLLCAALLMSIAPSAGAVSADSADAVVVFTDIADDTVSVAATALRSMGIISGTTDTTFAPDGLLTRAHVCKIIVNAMGLSGQVSSYARKTLFSDVASSAWYGGYVNLAYSKGIINGYGDGTFGPNNYITYGQLAAILLRMLGYSAADVGSVWPTDYTSFCEELGITGELELDPYQTLNRGQAAILVYNALQAETAGNGKAYYETISGVQSIQSAMLLDVDAAHGNADGLLMAAALSSNGASVKYYSQKNQISSKFAGYTGDLLLGSAGEVIGFIPDAAFDEMVTIQEADSTELTDSSGKQHKMADNAVIIVGESVYAWSGTGYLQANCWAGDCAWLFYDNNGEVCYICVPVTDAADAQAREVSSVQKVILLDMDAAYGELQGQMMVYLLSGNTAAVEYFEKMVTLPSAYEGQVGELLLNDDDKVVGFISAAAPMEEIVVASTKTSGIVDKDGVVHRISGSAVTIVGEDLYTWKDAGYLQLRSYAGKTARLYSDDSGAVSYVQMAIGVTEADTDILVAETKVPVNEAVRKFGITGTYSITKNGERADAKALAQYDVLYYDAASRTLRASDYQLTGYIEAAAPNVSNAETITVAGCTIPVMEAAWEMLESYTLGDRITLLLTDDGKAAAVASESDMVADMVGVLSANGKAVTLLGSGLTLTAADMNAETKLYGGLVAVRAYQGSLNCSAYTSKSAGSLDIEEGTLGSYTLAPVCEVYEHAGASDYPSYVYSLSGQQGVPSYDFDEIFWTDTIPAGSISQIHLNSAGQVDMILLREVTGNCYEYGVVRRYTGKEGIDLGSSGVSAYNAAATLTNSSNQNGSKKYLCALYVSNSDSYFGIALRGYSGSYEIVTSLAQLQKASGLTEDSVFYQNGEWYANIDGYEIPISESVQIYLKTTGQWLEGENGLKTVLAMNVQMDAYYDRSATTGGQVRVMTVSVE